MRKCCESADEEEEVSRPNIVANEATGASVPVSTALTIALLLNDHLGRVRAIELTGNSSA